MHVVALAIQPYMLPHIRSAHLALLCRVAVHMQVVFSLQLSCPAYDGAQGTGRKLSSVTADNPCRAQLGSGLLPAGLEAALCSMSKGERAVFVIPAADMRLEQPSSSSKQQSGLSIPELPAKCAQVEATIELLDLVQVR